MGMLDTFRINKAITTLLSSSDVEGPQRAQAIKTLRHIGTPAIPKLIQALAKASPSDTMTDLLVTLLDNASLPLFCQGLRQQDPRILAGVVRVLSQGEKYDPNRLFDLFTDAKIPKTDLVKVLVAHKDALQPQALLHLLNVVDKGGRASVFQLVEQVANAAMIPAMLPYIDHEDWLVRLHMARALSQFQTEAVQAALVRLLSDPHKNVRQTALEGLANLDLPMDVGPLCLLLRDADLTVQSKAIETLIRINDPAAVHHLLDILQDDSEYVRRAAVEVLNAVGNTSAIKDLLGALRDKDWWVRVRASDALGNIGGPKVVEAILPLIRDEDEFIRRCAVEVLNTTKDERAFEYLLEALHDRDWWVRERAVDALANLGDARAVPGLLDLLRDDTETTPAAIRALVTLGAQQATNALLLKLQSSDKGVQKEALRALASLTEAAHAKVVQETIVEHMHTLDAETQEVAQGTLDAITSKFGSRAYVREGTGVQATLVADQQLLGRSKTRSDAIHEVSDATAEGTVAVMEEPTDRLIAEPLIDPMTLAAGTVLAERYRVIRQVGRGAFGVVVLVDDMAVHEEIILKFLNPHLAANDQVIKRFVHEMRYTRRITHENVIRIYDFVTLGKSFAISMEYFPSHPLAAEIPPAASAITQRQLHIIHSICQGLSVAHNVNIVHRDLKPQNILVDDAGLVKIVDFGLAAAVSQTDSRLTGSGVLMGTPTYMSPEQARGLDIDTRTDIYSLGVIMYELFTGRPPYEGRDPIAVIYQHTEGKAAAPRELNPHIPPTLETIIRTAMAVDPHERYQHVDALRVQLETLLDAEVA